MSDSSLARAGQVLGAYRIDTTLGSGGMGVVYRAVEIATGRAVAMKLLRPAFSADPERRRRFLREARLAQSLDHPGVARVHEVGDVDGTVFIAMELVEGKSLRTWIAEMRDSGKQPSIEDAIAIARGIGAAVQHAHDKGIVHRDLKPDNVMVEVDLTVRVLDFGLAKLREVEGGALYEAETETNLTSEGRVLGTPGYMAPEQASGKEVGFRADVFAMGAILYELLTAKRAFVGDSPMDVIVAVTRDDPPLPSSVNPAVSTGLDELVMRCLAKKADARPAMDDLVRSLAVSSLLDKRVPPAGARSSRLVPGLLLGAVVVTAIGVGIRASRHGILPDTRPAALSANAMTSSTAPLLVPTAVTDLPLPASTVPAALAAYKNAIANERDGAEDAAFDDLENALKLDPELAAAQLRLAQRQAFIEAQSARGHFAQAVKLRDRLTPRDREWLEAAQPLFQQDPPDMDEWRRRLELLSARLPGDAELAYEQSTMRNVQGDFAGASEAAERAVRLDPRFALALSNLAEQQAYRGLFDASRATVARCLEVSPAASWCMWVREFVAGQQGRCAEVEASARQRIAIDPTLPDGYKALMFAMGAMGRPATVIRETIDQAAQRLHDPYRSHRLFLNLSIRLEAMLGDFVAATAHADELRAYIVKGSDVSEHAAAVFLSAEVEQEAGHRDRAAALAKEFLGRKEAWQNSPVVHDYTLADDLTPPIMTFVRHTKSMPDAEYEATLEAWRTRWKKGLRGDYRPYLWVYGYAPTVETREDAAAAMAVYPEYAPIPPFIPNGALPFATVGRTFWLGGHEAEGIEKLEVAARGCDTVVRPVLWVHAHAWLAEAFEEAKDVAAACKEYGVVLEHWGAARPRSVTADQARVRSRALGCDTLGRAGR
jgi:serine/threonine protein kinase/tetratricopeptide (TPR) repeat protein